MTDPDAAETTSSEATGTDEPEWRRKQRLAAIFGDVLPTVTKDEKDDAAPAAGKGESASEKWLKEQVPPHHGQ